MQANKTVVISSVIVAAALVVFLAAETRKVWQEYYYIGKSDRDTITIQGEGKVSSRPDVVKVTMGVYTEGVTVKDIQKKNADKMNAIIAAVKELGVKGEDIQTESYNISPRYDWTDGKQKLIGYSVSQNIAIKVRDMDKSGDVIAKGGELGANQIGGMSFTIDDPKALEAQARDLAIEDAKKKADVLANKLGLDIARVVSFSENSGTYQPIEPFQMMAKQEARDMANAVPQIEAGSQDVYSNVSVTFEVR